MTSASYTSIRSRRVIPSHTPEESADTNESDESEDSALIRASRRIIPHHPTLQDVLDLHVLTPLIGRHLGEFIDVARFAGLNRDAAAAARKHWIWKTEVPNLFPTKGIILERPANDRISLSIDAHLAKLVQQDPRQAVLYAHRAFEALEADRRREYWYFYFQQAEFIVILAIGVVIILLAFSGLYPDLFDYAMQLMLWLTGYAYFRGLLNMALLSHAEYCCWSMEMNGGTLRIPWITHRRNIVNDLVQDATCDHIPKCIIGACTTENTPWVFRWVNRIMGFALLFRGCIFVWCFRCILHDVVDRTGDWWLTLVEDKFFLWYQAVPLFLAFLLPLLTVFFLHYHLLPYVRDSRPKDTRNVWHQWAKFRMEIVTLDLDVAIVFLGIQIAEWVIVAVHTLARFIPPLLPYLPLMLLPGIYTIPLLWNMSYRGLFKHRRATLERLVPPAPLSGLSCDDAFRARMKQAALGDLELKSVSSHAP